MVCKIPHKSYCVCIYYQLSLHQLNIKKIHGMARIAKNLTELIGNTPLVQLSNYAEKRNLQANVIVKLELFNPAGCVKERIALAMIEDAEADGKLKKGAEIIEPTSGNTGIGLAMVAAVKGYKHTLTMPETMSIERRNLLKALCANLGYT